MLPPKIPYWALVGLLACMWQASAFGSNFSRFLDNGGWQSDSSVFSCDLRHSIPYYGLAHFQTRAGEDSKFELQPRSSRLKTGQASLLSKGPVWLEQSRLDNLGYVDIEQGLQPLNLNSQYTERMLSELYDGNELILTRKAWYGGEPSAQLTITNVGFRSAYKSYLACLSGLLPVNFDQIKRTSVYFGSNQFEDIRTTELRKLDNIVLYLQADPSVKEFFIDGHTDSVGTREDNLALAQRRAEEVVRYLVNKGIPENLIVSRWHGERYPITNNHSVMGRAQNRRVTVRLEKMESALDQLSGN